MTIIRCDSSHDAAWNGFVGTCPTASFYHRAEWRAINERCFGHRTAYLAALDEGRWVGVLPMVQLKSLLFGNIACSMPFVNFGGPAGLTDQVDQQLLDAAAEVADQWGVSYVEFRSRRFLGDRFPSAEHKVSLTIALDPNPETLLARLHREQRREIRRGHENGFTIKRGADLVGDFYTLLSEGWKQLGTPIYRRSYFEAILAAFPEHSRLTVVYAQDGRPAGAALDGLHQGTVEGMWMALRPEYRKQLIGYVLYWDLIKDACERGFTSYHLGRSSKGSGGESFKSKWNAESVQLYWQYILRSRADVPALNPSNPKYRLAIDAWRRLPVPVTQAVGPLLARSIP